MLSRPTDEMRQKAEESLVDIAAERDYLVEQAGEHEAAVANIQKKIARLDQYIDEIHTLLDL